MPENNLKHFAINIISWYLLNNVLWLCADKRAGTPDKEEERESGHKKALMCLVTLPAVGRLF